MGATAHLDLFNRTVAAFDSLSEDEADAYLDGDRTWKDGSDAASRTRSGSWKSSTASSKPCWKRRPHRPQRGLAPRPARPPGPGRRGSRPPHRRARVPDPEPGRTPGRGRRRRPADAPEFEVIIRELCDVAGHALVKITMGDPNYDHDGQTALAWHFTTDQGEFLMLEDDDEAFMIHPDTQGDPGRRRVRGRRRRRGLPSPALPPALVPRRRR